MNDKNIEKKLTKGVRSLKQGDMLFKQGDQANSLFIIQKGQVRLFLSKGSGFIELAILRAGEVLGEMSYFDETVGQKRNCSAQAFVDTDIIEIPFPAFGKALESLNPWFRTIINTMAVRLRKTNNKVKELESNSVSMGYGKKKEYEFFKNADVIKHLSVFYLLGKAQAGEGNTAKIHFNDLKYYGSDIFTLGEVKVQEFIFFLEEEGLISIEQDENDLPKVVAIKNLNSFREIRGFMASQKLLPEEKKVKVSEKCEIILNFISEALADNGLEESEEKQKMDLTEILAKVNEIDKTIGTADLQDAIEQGYVIDPVVDGGMVSLEVFPIKISKTFKPVKFTNALARFNIAKSKSMK